MNEYERAFKALNSAQAAAVKQINGPVLVIAGPGTGKTQLLSTRVGYILANTDALPSNILCLTFTEAGADAMRQRLSSFLGQEAYDVNISTYHGFGSDLIRYYPEYAGGYDLEPIDDLGADSLIRETLEAAPYSNPLKYADTYARDLRDFISDAKRALLTPADIKKIVKDNQKFIEQASLITRQILGQLVRIDKNSLGLFQELADNLFSKIAPAKDNHSLSAMALSQLAAAIEIAEQSATTKPLTAWKNNWLAKDGDGQFIFDGAKANLKVNAAADIYEEYQELCTKRRLYDYDDMILRAINALSDNPDFKFSLAERYQYILLDEFQDTNQAQMRLVELLTDNPVNEGQPNILAVGDDDQAIYAFQGAKLSNMARFTEIYKNVTIVALSENYRSHQKILSVAHHISNQIEQRLQSQFEGINKILTSAAKLPPGECVAHHSFISDAAQYKWVADEIYRLVGQGVKANEIAVLAPKHKFLTPLLAYLAELKLPVRYEKRENVLDKPIVTMLEQMSRLTVALEARDQTSINALWPQVLSYDFWGLKTELIWQLSWQADEQRAAWTSLLLDTPATAPIAQFFLRLKDLLAVTNLEQQLDILIGNSAKDAEDFELPMRSPMFDYYFGNAEKNEQYIGLLSDLSVLRGRLRRFDAGRQGPQTLGDFLTFTSAHRASGINILNSSPHHQAEDAVNIMTAFAAKGREFSAVFILAAQDEIWGTASRSQTSALGLPQNLKFIRYSGDNDDEKLRLFYVAITRAKHRLYLTSYDKTLDGKVSRQLKYLADNQALFEQHRHNDAGLSLDVVEAYWHSRHLPPLKAELKNLLAPRLDKYQLNPTHLNQFIDVIYAGPEQFFINSILRFPKGAMPAAQYGTVMHDTLTWAQNELATTGKMPSMQSVIKVFKYKMSSRRLSSRDQQLLTERGERALNAYLTLKADDFAASDRFEQSFRQEGVFVGKAHLAGKIDRLRFDKDRKTITVYDFKTGPSYDRWINTNATLHKYKQQLMIYKILVEKSHSYKGWTVDKGILEFIEPPEGENRVYQLSLDFDNKQMQRLEKLIEAVWEKVQALDFPDVSKYPKTMAGITAFENDLLGIDK